MADGRGDHLLGRRPEQGRRHVEAERHDEDEDGAGRHPAAQGGQQHLPDDQPRLGAEHAGGADLHRVELAGRGEDRQHYIREHHVDHRR